MAIDVKHWNSQFIEHFKTHGRALNQAAKYEVAIEEAKVEEGDRYWACVGVRHLTGRENMGNHNIFCDVLDTNGDRVHRARLRLWQGNNRPAMAVVDKPPNEAGTNFPIWGATPSDVEVIRTGGNLPSDKVTGFRINHPDEEVGNTIGHHSFYCVWQEVVAGKAARPVKPPPPVDRTKPAPPVKKGEILQKQQFSFQLASMYEVDVTLVIRHLGDNDNAD